MSAAPPLPFPAPFRGVSLALPPRPSYLRGSRARAPRVPPSFTPPEPSPMRRCLLALALVLPLAPARTEPPRPAATAEKPAAPPGTGAGAGPWTAEDVVLSESAAGFRFAPDGRAVVWVKTMPDKDKGEQVRQLVRTDLAD